MGIGEKLVKDCMEKAVENGFKILQFNAVVKTNYSARHLYEKLGFKEYKRFERDYDTVVFMECDGIILEVFVDSKHPQRFNDPETRGLRHVAFTVENLEDIMLIVSCEKIRTDWFGRKFTFTKDPDGQPSELKEKKQ